MRTSYLYTHFFSLFTHFSSLISFLSSLFTFLSALCSLPYALQSFLQPLTPRFTTLWHFDHPLDRVWEEIRLMDHWPEWWKYVESVEKIKNGRADEIGSVRRIRWSTALPYSLVFDSELTHLEYHKRMEGRAFGDLTGIGIWTFEPNGTGTNVRYDWRVNISKKWMILLEPILKPIFKWNHDQVMKAGSKGLEKRLESIGQREK